MKLDRGGIPTRVLRHGRGEETGAQGLEAVGSVRKVSADKFVASRILNDA